MHLLLRNSHVISPAQNINGKFDILIVNGVIAKMGVVWQHVREVMEYDMTGKVIIPGLFDMHVHFRWPGETEKEDIQSGSISAAYGGFTGVLCMPNTKPPIDSIEILNKNKLKAAGNIVDVFSSACVTNGRQGREISGMDSLSAAGALAFTDDGSPVYNEVIMKSALLKSAILRKPIVQHCQTLDSLDGSVNEGDISRKLNLEGISNLSEYEVIQRDIDILKNVPGGHYHVQHISTKESVELIRKAKEKGLKVTAEACPHHFILDESAILKYGTNAKMNPPLRTIADVEAVKIGLADDTIDIICTDHAPHTPAEKRKPLNEAPFGIIGLETAAGLTYTYLVKNDIISFEKMIFKMSVNPRALLNLAEIKISEGEKANLTILDIDENWKVDISKFHSKSKNSPFDGWNLQCKPKGIINNQQHLIYE